VKRNILFWRYLSKGLYTSKWLSPYGNRKVYKGFGKAQYPYGQPKQKITETTENTKKR